jgi:hypothetical protein
MSAQHVHHQATRPPHLLPFDQLKSAAAAVAAELRAFSQAPAASGGGSRQRALPEDLRQRFIDLRATLYTRGIYDPVLVRFDTASVTQATTEEVAQQLATVAEAL